LQSAGVGTANFEGIQGELNPGTNAVKFATKIAPAPGSRLKLIIYMNYKQPGSPRVTFEKKSIESGSKPSISITTNIMGEPQNIVAPVPSSK